MWQARALRILTGGMLLGPVDFETEKELTIPMTSSWDTSDKNIELKFGFCKNCEKWWLVGGISDLILFATELKKSLKESATFTGSVITELLTLRDMGLDPFSFPEIKDQTPFQTFCILRECKLK